MTGSYERKMQAAAERLALIRAFGKRVTRLREERGVSRQDLARMAGIDETSLATLERGQREPRLITLMRLSQGLDVSPNDLVRGLKVPEERTSGRPRRAPR